MSRPPASCSIPTAFASHRREIRLLSHRQLRGAAAVISSSGQQAPDRIATCTALESPPRESCSTQTESRSSTRSARRSSPRSPGLVVVSSLPGGTIEDKAACRQLCVDADGAVLDPGGFVVTEMAINDGWPSVSWSGVNFLVVLEADLQRQTSNVLGVRVLPFGIVLDDPAYPIAASSGWEYDVTSVSGTGTSSVVAYTRWPTAPRTSSGPSSGSSTTTRSLLPRRATTPSRQRPAGPGSRTVDIGNHCDDCVTTIDLPFPVRFYGRSYMSLNASSNASLSSSRTATSGATSVRCRASVSAGRSRCSGRPGHRPGLHGIFTAVTGSPPNRQFVVEWRPPSTRRRGPRTSSSSSTRQPAS